MFNVTPSSHPSVADFPIGAAQGVPAWSANGQEIAFNQHVGDSNGAYFGKVGIYDVSTGRSLEVLTCTDPTFDSTTGAVACIDHGGPGDDGGIATTTSDGGVALVPEGAVPSSPEFIPGIGALGFLLNGSLEVAVSATSNDLLATNVDSYQWISGFTTSAAVLTDGGTSCDLQVVASQMDGGLTTSSVVSSVGCGAQVAPSPSGSQLALADGSNVYLVASNSSQAESALSPFVAASGSVTHLGWTSDGAYVVYSTFAPDNAFPSQGEITLTFVPVGGGANRTLTTVGNSFAVSP